LVLNPAAQWIIESENLGAGSTRIIKQRVFPVTDAGVEASVHEDKSTGLGAAEGNYGSGIRIGVEGKGKRLFPGHSGERNGL
jgi:hypothetical protein